MKTLTILLHALAITACIALSACTPAQLQKADATQANINATAAAVQTNIDKAAPVVQADIVKATPYINKAADISLLVTGNGALIPLNDAATAIIERGQTAAAPKTTPPAATTTPATAALPTTPTTATSP